MASALRNRIVALRERITGGGNKTVNKILRRRKLTGLLWKALPSLRFLLLLCGYVWLLVIPFPQFGQRTYIDENALQPGQVTTNWNWGNVHRADLYLAELEKLRDSGAASDEISKYLSTEFAKLGIPASTQKYSYTTATEFRNGTNAYAVFSSPRASGTEAMIISASWLSRTGEGDGTLNLRGVATLLALAEFLKGRSLWAKDLIFVVSDGYLDGMQAWITAYHGVQQSNLQAEPLKLSSGVIWTALNIDYPGHSFSHLGVFFEGLNGRLPNQDLINSVNIICRNMGEPPFIVYDRIDSRGTVDSWKSVISLLPESIRRDIQLEEYALRAANLAQHTGYQARGKASGVHGLLHQFRIDAITLFAVPAQGPHGFHTIGRVLESTLRTTNNLLERLHASFFFYLFLGVNNFLKIGNYLPMAIIISTALMFGGLGEWVDAGWVETPAAIAEEKQTVVQKSKWVTRHRPVLAPLLIMLSTHLTGTMLFYTITGSSFAAHQSTSSSMLFGFICLLPFACWLVSPLPFTATDAPLPKLLKSLNLCLASTVISVTSVLNFSLAAMLALALGIPLSLPSPPRAFPLRFITYMTYMSLGFGWLLLAPAQVRDAVLDWEKFGVWFAPFVCIVYAPIVFQAALVRLIPS